MTRDRYQLHHRVRKARQFEYRDVQFAVQFNVENAAVRKFTDDSMQLS